MHSTFIMLTELMRMYVFFQITSVGEIFFQTATGLAFVLAHVARKPFKIDVVPVGKMSF